MQILPVSTTLLRSKDDLAVQLQKNAVFEKGDILIVSSKAIATVEGAAISLTNIKASSEALELSLKCNQDPRFTEFVLAETKRMNGAVIGVAPHVLLTSLKPTGLKNGRILCPNAGADQSNIEDDYAIGWPVDPVRSTQNLSKKLGVPVIISDSCCVMGRIGVTAFALVCAGIDPFRSEIGKKDLFGKTMRMTQEAIADQLAIAGNSVMGNSAQSIPAAIIRDSLIPSSDFIGWVDGINQQEDLFGEILRF